LHLQPVCHSIRGDDGQRLKQCNLGPESAKADFGPLLPRIHSPFPRPNLSRP